MKKAVSLFLALVLALSLTVPAFAASEATFSLNTKTTKVEAGDSLSLELKVDKAMDDVESIEFWIYYNAEVFELTGGEAGKCCGDAKVAHSSKSFSDAKGAYYKVTAADFTNGLFDIKAGTIYTLTFKAKDTVTAGTATFTLSNEGVYGKLSSDRDVTTGSPVSVTTAAKTVAVTSVTVAPATLDLEVGQTKTLTATVKPDNATDKTVTWKTSNNEVATVDSNGVVTAVAKGTATITAAAGAKTATCKVTVTVPAPDKPTKPSEGDVKDLLTSDVRVVDDTGLHATKDYQLKNVANSFTVGEVTTKNGLFICPVTIKYQPFVDQYSKDVGKTHTLIKNSQTETVVELVAKYDTETNTWKWTAAKADRYATIHVECEVPAAPTAEDLKELGVIVDVDCKKAKHTAKDYALSGDETLTVTEKEENGVWIATVSLSKDSAKSFLKQYSKDVGKSHTKLVTNGTVDLKLVDGKWQLADAEKNVLNITTDCSTSGGGSTDTKDNTKTDGKKVESGKTFDAGIAMYVGLSVLSVTGGALVIGKKKERF